MDKRTLIFLMGMTVLFFAMHQWFSPDVGNYVTKTQTEIFSDISFPAQATPPVLLSQKQKKDAKIVNLYYNVQLTEFASLAVQDEDSYVVVGWTENLPTDLYTEATDESVKSTLRLSLKVEPKEAGAPALYAAHPLAKITTPQVHKENNSLIQLIYFKGDQAYRIQGKAEKDERLFLDSRPPVNALAFIQINGTWALFGTYYPDDNVLLYLNDEPLFDNYVVLSFPSDKQLSEDVAEEKYYVLENAYQQLVFSNLNGAVAEINLPFQSPTNQKSVVHPIEFDRLLEKESVRNDTYPQFPYFLPSQQGAEALHQPVQGGYYPLLRRNIMGKTKLLTKLNPYYYAMNVYHKGEESDVKIYELKRLEKDLIEFEYKDDKKRITKTFTLPKKADLSPYAFNLSVKVEGDARELILTSGLPEVELISGKFDPTLKFRSTVNQKRKVEAISTPKDEVSFQYVSPDWVCDGNGFFGIVIDPLTKVGSGFSVFNIPGEVAPTRISVIDAQYQRYPLNKFPAYSMQIPLPAQAGETKFRIFTGPFDKNILQQLDQTYTRPAENYFPDYTACQTYHGWFSFILQPFSQLLSFLLNFFYTVTHSWGFSIILITIALRLMLYPLNSSSMRSMAKMQGIAPKVTVLQEKYKKDPQRARLEIAALYKKEKVNPLGGCLPLLIQMPFLFGMLNLLKSSFQLRGVSFIPGWIDNLTAPDIVFSWTYPLPFLGNSFHLLPVLLGACMFLQQRISSKKPEGVTDTSQQKQSKMMGNVMTIVFTFLFYHFPSGLNIYWISTTVLAVLQQWWIQKKLQEANTLQLNRK